MTPLSAVVPRWTQGSCTGRRAIGNSGMCRLKCFGEWMELTDKIQGALKLFKKLN